MKPYLNNYIPAIGLAITMMVMGCDSDDDLGTIPDWNENIGAVTIVTPDPDNTFFNALNSLENESIGFTLDVDGYGVTEVNSVELMLTYIEKDGDTDAEGNPVDRVYDAVLVKEVSSFPADVTVSGQEVAQALGRDPGDFEVGDRFQLTFPINTADGRRLVIPLSSDLCQQPAQPAFGGCSYSWAIACPSNIPNGSYDVVVSGSSTDPNPADPNPSGLTGTVELSGSNGTYTLSDLSGGLYDYWYCAPYGLCGPSPGTFTDVCNNLSIINSTSSLSGCCGDVVNGSGSYDPDTGVITLSWTNAFGDTGQLTLTPQ